jgi:hypothetical protein
MYKFDDNVINNLQNIDIMSYGIMYLNEEKKLGCDEYSRLSEKSKRYKNSCESIRLYFPFLSKDLLFFTLLHLLFLKLKYKFIHLTT